MVRAASAGVTCKPVRTPTRGQSEAYFCVWEGRKSSLTMQRQRHFTMQWRRRIIGGRTFSIVARGVASSCAPSLARVPARLAPRLATHTAFHVSRLRCRRLLEMEQHAASHTARPSCKVWTCEWTHSGGRRLCTFAQSGNQAAWGREQCTTSSGYPGSKSQYQNPGPGINPTAHTACAWAHANARIMHTHDSTHACACARARTHARTHAHAHTRAHLPLLRACMALCQEAAEACLELLVSRAERIELARDWRERRDERGARQRL
eukprot:363865-Chlamydomonas_euryale.AAC.29